MKLVATILASVLLAGGLAVYSAEDILKDYGKIFSVKVVTKGDQKVAQQTMFKLPDSHYLAGMVNENPRMLLYLVENYAHIDEEKLNEMISDPDELEKYYLESLRNDSTFNKYFLAMAGNYLASKNHTLEDFTVQKDTIPMDTLMSVAARFFHADEVRADGNIGWKIVQGIDSISQYQEVHRPIAEAFSFAAILTNYKTSNIATDFQTNAGKAMGEQQVVVGQIDDAKLQAVRKGVYDHMAQSEALRTVLKDEYEKRKDVLDFVLAE